MSDNRLARLARRADADALPLRPPRLRGRRFDRRDRRRRSSAWAGLASGPRCCGARPRSDRLHRPRHDRPGHAVSHARGERRSLPSCHRSRVDPRGAVPARVLLARPARPRVAFAAITDPGTSLGQLAAERGFHRPPRRTSPISVAATRRSRTSASSPPPCIGYDLAEFCEAPARDGRGVPARGWQPGPRARRCGSGTAGARGSDKVMVIPTPGGFGLWVEQLLAESTGKQGNGLFPVPGEDERRRRPSPSRCAINDPCELGRGVLPLGVRHRHRGRADGDRPVRRAQRARGEGHAPRRSSTPATSPARARRLGATSSTARPARATTVSIQAFVAPTARADELTRRAARARALHGLAASRPRPGSARATCTPPASSTRAARRAGSPCRSCDAPRGSRDPGPGLRLPAAIRAPGGRRPRGLRRPRPRASGAAVAGLEEAR